MTPEELKRMMHINRADALKRAEREAAQIINPLREKIAQLEAENAALREKIAKMDGRKKQKKPAKTQSPSKDGE